jgi:hypothetical protein
MAEMDKVDAPSRHLLMQHPDGSAESARVVGLLLRGREHFTDSQLQVLRADGAEVRTVAGDVLTASATLAALPALARHDFVVAVQLSQPLRPEDAEQAASFYDVE